MNFLKKNYGQLLLVILCAVPVFLWLFNAGFTAPFSSFGIFLVSLGKAAALIGMTLFFLNPVLSMRHHLVETLFGGLDTLYRLHSKSGKLSFLFIALHPILLGAGRLLSDKSLGQIWDWGSFLVWSGIVGLAVFASIVATTIYLHLKHQYWVMIHRYLGWLIIIFFVHALVARSQLLKAPGLLLFFVNIGLLGFCAYLYRSVLYRIFVKKFPYVVSEINELSETVIELVLKPVGVPIAFQAGQFVYLSFYSPAIDKEPHPFSFSNANNGPYIRFTIKMLGDDTKKLKMITKGTKVDVEGPYGHFSYRRVKNKKQVWIAGGIGITPFLSMARSFSGKEDYKVRFFYGTESLDEAVFLQEFIDITRHLPDSFDTRIVSKNFSGFVSVDMLRQSLSNLAEFDYFICGPPTMMKTLKKNLSETGVPLEQIHTEDFSY